MNHMITKTRTLSQEALEQILTEARTHSAWLSEPVRDDLLEEIYKLMKWGPTSANSSPARIVFVKSPEAKEKLLPCMAEGNVEKTKAAPVTAIIAQDMEFYERLPKLFPFADARSWFAGNKPFIESTAFRNSTLQGAYFIIAARALGFDCGPMSGFDNAKVDEEFFGSGFDREGMSEEYVPGTIKSNFLCNIGHGDPASVRPRAPRLDFSEVCRVL